MASILPTGAGFSRNWGGWLTTEAFEYLLGRPEINLRLRNIHWACNGNFESALQEARGRPQSGQDDSASDDLSRFNAMLSAMFESMKMGYRRTPLETDQVASAIRTDKFLSEFDAIFTLNQDTLLEQHYMYRPAHEATHGRWQGVEVPSLEEPSPVVQHGS